MNCGRRSLRRDALVIGSAVIIMCEKERYSPIAKQQQSSLPTKNKAETVHKKVYGMRDN